MIRLENITERTSEIAKKAGEFIKKERSRFDSDSVEKKGKSDLVSYVDREAEQLIVNELRVLLPEAGYITEEDTIEQSKNRYTWIIDPLDGTTNFIHSVPTFAVSIALMLNSEIVSGVVYEINRDECFSAYKGGGAFLNSSRIQVSNASTLSESLIATGFPPSNFHKSKEYLAILGELMEDVHGLRRVGSAATDLAYVAAGRYEGFFESNLKPWDVAAGIIIVREAGGYISDFEGGKDFLFGNSIVAAGKAHGSLLVVIKKHWMSD